MVEPEFEIGLQRLFAEAPAMPDAEAFARQIEARLDRGWAIRRLVIGVIGLVGGLLAIGQVMSANLVDRAETASNVEARNLTDGFARLAHARITLPDLPFGPEVWWMAAMVVALGAAILVTRTVDEF